VPHVRDEMAIHGSPMFERRRSPGAGGRLMGSLALAFTLGCATSTPPPPDRLSPEQLRNGPSLYETGRLAVVQPSSGGLQIDAGATDRVAPRPAVAHASARRKARKRAQRTP
jgi:hypothetical protein